MQENRVIAPGQPRSRDHDEDGEPLVTSRPVELRELSEEARCVPCLQRARACYVQEGLDCCLQCAATSTGHECIFIRKVVRQERLKFFSWAELTGFNNVNYRQPGPIPQQQINYQEPPRQLQYTPYVQPGPPESHDRGWNAYPPQSPLGQPFSNGPMPPPKRQRTDMYDGQDVFGHSRNSSLPTVASDWSSPRRPEYHLPEIRPLEPSPTRRPNGEVKEERPSTAPHERNGKMLDLKPPSTIPTPLKRKLELLEPHHDLNLPHRCAKCEASFKTPAELKKHFARHEPQYFCNIPSCPRGRDGFTTKNDLDRHRKTMHKILSPNDRFWKCFFPDCAKTEKVWPRLDNFKAHIVRMHGQQYVQENVTKAEEWWDAQKTNPMLGRSPETTHDLVPIEPKPAHEQNRLGVTNLLQENTEQPNGRRRHLSAEGRQEAAQVREMGACLRCALLKEKCDDNKTCHRCQSYSSKHFNGALICRRGTISDYLGEIIPLFHNLPQPDEHTTGWNLRKEQGTSITFVSMLDNTFTPELSKYEIRKNTFTTALFRSMDTFIASMAEEQTGENPDCQSEINSLHHFRAVCQLLLTRVADVLRPNESDEEKAEKIKNLQRTNLELREWYDELDNSVFDWKSRNLELDALKKWNLFFSICATFVMEQLTVLLTRAWAHVTEVHDSAEDEARDTLCALLEFKFQRQSPPQHHFISMLLEDKEDGDDSPTQPSAKFMTLPCMIELKDSMAFLKETKGFETWRYLYERFGETEEKESTKTEDSDDSDTMKVDTAKPAEPGSENVNGTGRAVRSRRSMSKNEKESKVKLGASAKRKSSSPDAMSE